MLIINFFMLEIYILKSDTSQVRLYFTKTIIFMYKHMLIFLIVKNRLIKWIFCFQIWRSMKECTTLELLWFPFRSLLHIFLKNSHRTNLRIWGENSNIWRMSRLHSSNPQLCYNSKMKWRQISLPSDVSKRKKWWLHWIKLRN